MRIPGREPNKYVIVFFVQPDTVTGDIIFILQQKDHPKFKRKGDDLFYEHTLFLTEALCGFSFVLTHLDNRQLLIKSNPGEVIKPGKHFSLQVPSVVFKHGRK
jgi:DnaJ homolog subfamily A member 2